MGGSGTRAVASLFVTLGVRLVAEEDSLRGIQDGGADVLSNVVWVPIALMSEKIFLGKKGPLELIVKVLAPLAVEDRRVDLVVIPDPTLRFRRP